MLAPPPRLKISEWADRFAYIPEEGNAEPGKYRVSRIPYQRDMLDDPLDPTVTEHVWMIGAQLGKTLCFILIIEYFIDHQPTAILVMYPTLDSAKSWMREKFIPATKATPRLLGKLKEPRARDSESTTLNRKFQGGNLTACGANSTSGLRQRSKRVVMQDEIDDYNTTDQGDPCAQADKRAETFHNAVKLKSSTCTRKGSSRVEELYEKSDKQKYFCPCPRCGAHQVLDFWQIKWPKKESATGRVIWDEEPNGEYKHITREAIYECIHCKERLTDSDRIWMIEHGEWRATAPFNGVRGRNLSGVYQMMGKKDAYSSYLQQFAEGFLAAKRSGPEAMEVWTNLFLNQTWEEATETLDAKVFLDRREPYTPETLPADIILIVGGADVQKDRIELEWVGVGNEEETWGIEAIKVFGDTEKPETWKRLSQAIDREFKRVDGIRLRPTAMAIDFHFRPKITKEWCATHGTRSLVFPVIGIGAPQGILVMHRPKHRTWTVSADTAKDIIFSRLKIEVPGPHYCHFPLSYPAEWFQQLTSEKIVTRHTRGFPKRVYEKPSSARNEALDMRVYGLACLDILRPNMAAIAASLKPADKPKEPKPKRDGWVIQSNQRGGWVSGWKV